MKVEREISRTKIAQSIIIPNPMNRKVIVKPNKSGYDKKQVFTNGIFPNKIDANLLGFSRTDDGKIHPAYLLGVTNEVLWLGEKRGYDNGINIMDEICTLFNSYELSGIRCYPIRPVVILDTVVTGIKEDSINYWVEL